MAPMYRAVCLFIFVLNLFYMSNTQSLVPVQKYIPEIYRGSWYSREDGVDTYSTLDDRVWDVTGTNNEKLQFVDIFVHPNDNLQEGYNSTLLVNSGQCFYCMDILWRTPNILQYRKSSCVRTSDVSINQSCTAVKTGSLPDVDDTVTMFFTAPKDINCISTFEGMYQFSYEVDIGGGGICNHPDSEIKACQDPGSKYVDNQVFYMKYVRCPGVQTSRDRNIRYACMGTWFAMRSGVGYTFAAISNTVEEDTREKFKCLMTIKNQKDAMNQIRWVMSRFPECTQLKSISNGPTKLVLTRVPPTFDYINPKCNLPRNITGKWFTQGMSYRATVTINDTHVKFYTALNEFEYQEVYYSCQQTLGTRYLMTKVTVGKCEVDFVCFDLMPRHHSIVRYRIGKPNRLTVTEMQADPNFLTKKFREACSWLSFTFNRDDTNWKYEVLILNPPNPVPCPIAGRYNFIQEALRPEEKFSTRIRGVTDKPRVQVDCRITVSELKSCSNDLTKMEVDAEYCESVDYRGRPIGEYDVSDNILTCVGFWMEDYKSYLITWDEEDAISAFRCWVYERISWTDVTMSRSQNARCPRDQTAHDYLLSGTGLRLEMYEAERLFDDCPQRFDPGIDPYKKPTIIYVLSGSSLTTPSCSLISFLLLVILKWFH